MQFKLLYHGEDIDCEQSGRNCETAMCSRDLMLRVVKSLVRPQLMPVIHRIFEVHELFQLADVVSMGENQLYHVVRMCEHVVELKDSFLSELGVEQEELLTAVLFYDCGKSSEVDDNLFIPENCKQARVPRKLRNCGIPEWAEYYTPMHDHLERSVRIAESYDLKETVLEAIALHHHVKILPELVYQVARALYLPHVICEDILRHKPGQHVAKGSTLAQVLGIVNQICAIERKFGGRVYLAREPEKIEDELVKDLVIGVTDSSDPRLGLLGISLAGNETVILFDLRGFGEFVQNNSEYKVQATKREVLKTIRSVIRVQDHHRDKDMVGLIGGDEYAVITRVRDEAIIDKMIERIKSAIMNRTGLNVRYGYSMGGVLEENFHAARDKANLEKHVPLK